MGQSYLHFRLSKANLLKALLIKIQFASGIPWLPYIIICGVTVRLVMAPLMIRQMILINKMGAVRLE